MKRIIAVTALGVAIVGVLIAGIVFLAVTLTSTQSDVNHLKKEVASLEAQGVTMNNRVTTLESESSIGDVAKLNTAVLKIEQCVPQMQNEITSLSISGSYYGTPTSPAVGFAGQVAGWPLSISYSQQLSPECQNVFANFPGP